jgi:site-specific DNA-methyltransferase (adenine-specific)
MFVFSKGNPKTWNPIKIPTITGGQKKEKDGGYRQKDGTTKPAGYETRKMTKTIGNIWRYSVGGKRNNHPTSFPEKLAEDHILSWSNEGDILLDPFAGSGTTLKMAKKNNRDFIGIEISPEYIKIINERLKVSI